MSIILVLIEGIDDDESVYNAGGATTSSAPDDQIWPSMQDLNTRLRRVITSYQRNYKKEELKQQQKAKVCTDKTKHSVTLNIIFFLIIWMTNGELGTSE